MASYKTDVIAVASPKTMNIELDESSLKNLYLGPVEDVEDIPSIAGMYYMRVHVDLNEIPVIQNHRW
jgi:hypothetical protein